MEEKKSYVSRVRQIEKHAGLSRVYTGRNIVVLVDSVDALGTVSAGVGHAFVYVDLAIGAGRAGPTAALVPVDQILARAAVLARRGRALVQLVLA